MSPSGDDVGGGLAGEGTNGSGSSTGPSESTEGMHAELELRRFASDGSNGVGLRRLQEDGQERKSQGPRPVRARKIQGDGEPRHNDILVSANGQSDGSGTTEGDPDQGATSSQEEEGLGGQTEVFRGPSELPATLPEGIKALLAEHPWVRNGALADEAARLGLSSQQAEFVMLRTLPPPFTQSVGQAERILGIPAGTCAHWTRNEKVGKAIVKASLAVGMSGAPEIIMRTVHMAREGDKFQTRMWYEHVATLARDPNVMGSDFGRALAGISPGEEKRLTVAISRRSNGRRKGS